MCVFIDSFFVLVRPCDKSLTIDKYEIHTEKSLRFVLNIFIKQLRSNLLYTIWFSLETIQGVRIDFRNM